LASVNFHSILLIALKVNRSNVESKISIAEKHKKSYLKKNVFSKKVKRWVGFGRAKKNHKKIFE
jgi:hypothetical protein